MPDMEKIDWEEYDDVVQDDDFEYDRPPEKKVLNSLSIRLRSGSDRFSDLAFLSLIKKIINLNIRTLISFYFCLRKIKNSQKATENSMTVLSID